MTQKQILAELKPWLKAYQDIESAFADWEKLAPISDLDKSPLWKGYYTLFDLYTDQLAARLGGDASTWLPWFIYDNDCGTKRFSVTSLSNSATDSICNLKDLSRLLYHPANTPNLTQYADRAIGTLTDTELEAISEELDPLTDCVIAREGFNDFALTWFAWVWTPDGWCPDPASKCTHWPLAPHWPLSHVVELATNLRKALPAF